ncbi:PREDICTED: senecionine N-oxygenase-like isoform X1 [Nicrophorus vespilloides]|uniref:Flavin-containing monooxygenase n=1 Tax=Nicrophorus vespilloides TaxID=110193 RepID=A0ABM1M9Y2_NICVS|nr:PREDICTED: senecionine N-oxygenase-like isoform X1 [Nicrophorus vespilloides]
MRVGIIGAGAAGLTSAKHIIQGGHDCEVLELQEDLGGTWIYSDDVGADKYGFPIYSAMYQNLRTNSPKEIMAFPDLAFPDKENSYLTQAEVLNYLHQYADKFNLRPHIKFNRFVVEIKPLEGNRWIVRSINKINKEEIEDEYDAIMICNGIYNEPDYPTLEGIEKFTGLATHSHQFRSPKRYKGQRVIVMGAGPSGFDITLNVSEVATKVIFSHHSTYDIKSKYPDNVEQRCDIKKILNENTVEFIDGSVEEIDAIIYCTGYLYSYPFLHESCGITITENYVQHLYKHLINIKYPTMCLIGIPFNVCALQMFDLQARFFTAYLDEKMKLPDFDQMLNDEKSDMEERIAKGYTKRKAHLMGVDQNAYYDMLAKTAKLKPIPPVMTKLFLHCIQCLICDLMNFRDLKFKIIDEENFIQIL